MDDISPIERDVLAFLVWHAQGRTIIDVLEIARRLKETGTHINMPLLQWGLDALCYRGLLQKFIIDGADTLPRAYGQWPRYVVRAMAFWSFDYHSLIEDEPIESHL